MNAIQMMLITISHSRICVLASTSHEYANRNTNANAVMNHSVARRHLFNVIPFPFFPTAIDCHHADLPARVAVNL